MASSLLKNAKDHVEEGLEKVRAKSWATPLGKALQVSGKIVGAVEDFVPGAKLLGGALSFGATLLHPEPTLQELQEQLRETKAAIEGTSSQLFIQALEKVQLELEDKIANPVGEIKVEFAEVRADMKRIFSEVGESSNKMTLEMSKLRDLISRTFQIVVDNRFKDGIETVDSAYNVFLRIGFKDFQQYAFELQTCADKNLDPQRVKEYLVIIYQEQGFAVTQATMEYILAVTSKYLQMLVAYSIFKEDPDQVADHFEQFNRNFEQMCRAFKEVTNQTFKAGQDVEALKPVARVKPTGPVKPTHRESKQELGLTDLEKAELQQFFVGHGLQGLLGIFLKEGVALDDVLEMTDTEMKELGITAFSHRKRLLKVIEGHRHQASGYTASVSEEQVQVQGEALRASQDANARSSLLKVLKVIEGHRHQASGNTASVSEEQLSSPVATSADEKKVDSPGLVELRSSEGAGECVGDALGLYQLLPDGGEGGRQGPVYRQRHDGDNQQFYLYRAGKFWWVSKKVGKKGGCLKAKVVTGVDELIPPLKGFVYSGEGMWESDQTLECSKEVSPPCTEVRVELQGKPKEKQPECAGSYLPQGKTNRGRWVLQHSSGSDRYLTVPTGTTSWGIGETIDGSGSFIKSASAGGPCPAQASNAVSNDPNRHVTSWLYADGGRLKESGQIRLVCKTHT